MKQVNDGIASQAVKFVYGTDDKNADYARNPFRGGDLLGRLTRKYFRIFPSHLGVIGCLQILQWIN
jgi:hypothetical protein